MDWSHVFPRSSGLHKLKAGRRALQHDHAVNRITGDDTPLDGCQRAADVTSSFQSSSDHAVRSGMIGALSENSFVNVVCLGRRAGPWWMLRSRGMTRRRTETSPTEEDP